MGLVHMTFVAVAEHSKKQWHTHSTYFLPGGGGASGWDGRRKESGSYAVEAIGHSGRRGHASDIVVA